MYYLSFVFMLIMRGERFFCSLLLQSLLDYVRIGSEVRLV